MGNLYSGMLWLRRPSDRPDKALTEAVAYAEEKHGRAVRLIARPEMEADYPESWNGIPVRADRRVQASHVYLVMGVTPVATEQLEHEAEQE